MCRQTLHQFGGGLEKISPELGWLLVWVRPPELRPSAETLKEAAGRVQDWRRVLETAHENGVAPLLSSNLRGRAGEEWGMPAWLEQELDQRRQACLARSARVAFHLAPVLKELHEAGVPAMLLKGALLAETLYPDPGARSFFDVDLLVEPGDVPQAYRILQRAGYAAIRPVDFSRPPPVGIYLNSVLCRSGENQGSLIHLHWHLVNTSLPSDDYVFRVGMQELWAGAQRLQLWDTPLLAPQPHHLLVQLSEHAYRSGFGTLSRLVDVAWASPRREASAFWERVAEVAYKWGLATPCYSSWLLCSGLGLAPVPADVLASLRPPGRHWLADRILRRTLERPGRQVWGKLLYLAHRRGLRQKLRFVLQGVFPPAAEVEAIYGLAPGSLGVIGYLRRVLHRVAVSPRKIRAAIGRLT